MGCKQSTAADREIQAKLLETDREERKVKKLLLLGVGSSGKSTLFRQTKELQNGEKPDDTVRDECSSNVRANVTECIIKLARRTLARGDEFGIEDIG